jgi:hypothetical protein
MTEFPSCRMTDCSNVAIMRTDTCLEHSDVQARRGEHVPGPPAAKLPLDETLQRIDAVLAEHAAKLAARPQCLHCARQALIGSDLCAYHLQPGPLPTTVEPRRYVAFDEACRPDYLRRALRNLFG